MEAVLLRGKLLHEICSLLRDLKPKASSCDPQLAERALQIVRAIGQVISQEEYDEANISYCEARYAARCATAGDYEARRRAMERARKARWEDALEASKSAGIYSSADPGTREEWEEQEWEKQAYEERMHDEHGAWQEAVEKADAWAAAGLEDDGNLNCGDGDGSEYDNWESWKWETPIGDLTGFWKPDKTPLPCKVLKLHE